MYILSRSKHLFSQLKNIFLGFISQVQQAIVFPFHTVQNLSIGGGGQLFFFLWQLVKMYRLEEKSVHVVHYWFASNLKNIYFFLDF